MSVFPVSPVSLFYDGEIWSDKFLDKFLKTMSRINTILNENSSN